MIWSDTKIRENQTIIEPFDESLVQPNSYDVTLGDKILIDNPYGWWEESLPYTLKKGEFVLGTTVERVNIPNGVVCQIEGKSSNARDGLCIHITAGYCECGFNGQITLEMVNHSTRGFTLTPGMKIGQLIFYDAYESEKLYGECGNHYQNQTGTTPSWRCK